MGAHSPIPPGFGGAYVGRKVLLTGHTGFKGSWLALWLERLGAEIVGIALPPETDPALFQLAQVGARCDSREADINDPRALDAALGDFRPDLIIHMAAQAIVRDGYDDPAGTFRTNVIGTANVLEIARRLPTVEGVIVVTSDKCYENREWDYGYREDDPLGGHDPYSASKACAELVAQSYRRSFFADPQGVQLATVRAGNVIGGGDWSRHRLIPDVVRATAKGLATVIRNPGAVRPWQHVLEPLAGYLMLGARMLAQPTADLSDAWNFGPGAESAQPVGQLCETFAQVWGGPNPPRFALHHDPLAPHEAGILRLDSTKAQLGLGWKPQLTLPETLSLTADWYRSYLEGDDMARLTLEQITAYEARLAADSAPSPQPAVAAE